MVAIMALDHGLVPIKRPHKGDETIAMIAIAGQLPNSAMRGDSI